MEKAVLKTLIYADIFDFPLTVFEIHKWLIGEKITLRQVEKTLEELRVKRKALRVKGYYFLIKRQNLVSKRKRNKKYVQKYLNRAKIIANILRLIPWIKLVGISGGLAIENVSKKDDIDLFLITEKNRLWLSRLLSILLLNIFRRKVSDNKKEVSGKICLNLLLDTNHLIQESKEIYTAHEVLQMRVCWERDGVYHKFLSENDWVFKYLPNWIGNQNNESRIKNYDKKQKNHDSRFIIHNSITDLLEKMAKKFQLKIMTKPIGMEKINDGALYFHPKDYRSQVISKYNKKVKAGA